MSLTASGHQRSLLSGVPAEGLPLLFQDTIVYRIDVHFSTGDYDASGPDCYTEAEAHHLLQYHVDDGPIYLVEITRGCTHTSLREATDIQARSYVDLSPVFVL